MVQNAFAIAPYRYGLRVHPAYGSVLRIRLTGYGLRVTGYGLRVTAYGLRVAIAVKCRQILEPPLPQLTL